MKIDDTSTEKTPAFSIIIPVYNTEKYLRECVESILHQKFSDYEIILVNDASTDGSGKICDEYANDNMQVNTIHHESNKGSSEARNTGIRVARGKYLLFLDSDDFYIGENLSTIYNKLQGAPDVDVMFLSMSKCIEKEGKNIITPYRTFSESDFINNTNEEILEKTLSNDFYNPSAGAKLVKKEIVMGNEIYFEEGIVAEDLPWTFNLLLQAKSFLICEGSHYAYRMRAGSITHSKNTINRNVKDLLNFISGWAEYCKTRADKIGDLYLGQLAYQYSIIMGLFLFLSKEDRKLYFIRIKELSWVLEYATERKAKLVKRLYKILGFRICALILNMYLRVKDSKVS